MILDSATLERNPHRFLLQLKEMLQPQRTKYGYIRVIPTGAFTEVYDYGIGILYIRIEWHTNGEGYIVRFCIGCADDGDWEAESENMSKREALSLIEELRINILEKLITVPTEKELNKLLQNFGLSREIE